jgi:hypothetical protein
VDCKDFKMIVTSELSPRREHADLGALIERDTQALSDPPMLRTYRPELRINSSDEAFDPSPAPLQVLQSVVVLSCGQRGQRGRGQGLTEGELRRAIPGPKIRS